MMMIAHYNPQINASSICADTRTALVHCVAARLEAARRRAHRSKDAAAHVLLPGADRFIDFVCFALEEVERDMEHLEGYRGYEDDGDDSEGEGDYGGGYGRYAGDYGGGGAGGHGGAGGGGRQRW